jgi:transcriptional regulator with XRE-family HTH domain
MEASRKKPFRVNRTLRAARERRGWSQAALAHLMGTSELTVGRWERGERTPQLIYRARLCELFEMSAEELGLVRAQETEIPAEDEEAPACSEVVISPPSSSDLVAVEPPLFSEMREKRVPAESGFFSRVATRARWVAGPRAGRDGAVSPYVKWIGLWACLLASLVAISIPGSLLLVHAFPSTARKVNAPTVVVFSNRGSLPDPTTTPPHHIGALSQSNQRPRQQSAAGSCSLTGGVYHVQASGVHYCLDEKQWLSDFEYRVRVVIRKGTQAGIIFRGTTDGHFYYFSVDIAGHYALDLINPPAPVTTLTSGFNHVVVPEAGQSNLLDVVAHGSLLRLYVNGTQVGQVMDGSYMQGYVGICVGNYDDVGGSGSRGTVGEFEEAKVW